MAQLVASMSGVVLEGVVEVVGSNLARGKLFTSSIGSVDLYYIIYIYVQRKVRIGTIPELYLRIVRIPTLSADSGIVPDNSRIAQGVFYRFLL